MGDMIAYCGLDCEKCDAYLATIHDDQALREKTAKLCCLFSKFHDNHAFLFFFCLGNARKHAFLCFLWNRYAFIF